jgi:hypothetical protein
VLSQLLFLSPNDLSPAKPSGKPLLRASSERQRNSYHSDVLGENVMTAGRLEAAVAAYLETLD